MSSQLLGDLVWQISWLEQVSSKQKKWCTQNIHHGVGKTAVHALDWTACLEACDRPAVFGKKAMEYVNRQATRKAKKTCHKLQRLRAAVTNVQERKTIRHIFSATRVTSLFVKSARQKSTCVLTVVQTMSTRRLYKYDFGRLLRHYVVFMTVTWYLLWFMIHDAVCLVIISCRMISSEAVEIRHTWNSVMCNVQCGVILLHMPYKCI